MNLINVPVKIGSIANDRTILTFLLIVSAVTVKALVLFIGLPLILKALTGFYNGDLFPDQYDLIAMNLIQGRGYRFLQDTAETTIRTPGIVLVLAAIFWAFGKSLAAVKAFNLVLSTFTAYIVYRLGLRITAEARVGAAAALLYFFFPGTIVSDSRGGYDSLLAFCIALFVLLAYQALQKKNIADYAAAGASFGVLMLVKSTAGLFPVALLIYLLVIRPGSWTIKTKLTRLTVFALAAVLIMSPWIIRNAQLTGRFIPVAASGNALFVGSYIAQHQGLGKEWGDVAMEAVGKEYEIARAMGMPFSIKETPVFPQFYTTKDELRYYDHLGDLVKQDYWRHPNLLVEVIEYNSVAFWIQGNNARATFINTILIGSLLIMTIGGAVLSVRRKYHVMPLILFIGAFYMAHLAIIGMARYCIPLVPLMSIFAAISSTWLIDRLNLQSTTARLRA
jgi:4-amino-4-deoxy-L-arabinose transferase-like glycosyltransferase